MKKKLIVSIVLILATASVCGLTSIAASSQITYGLKSQGRIIFSNGTEDPADDVIFDATDLYNLAAKCQ